VLAPVRPGDILQPPTHGELRRAIRIRPQLIFRAALATREVVRVVQPGNRTAQGLRVLPACGIHWFSLMPAGVYPLLGPQGQLVVGGLQVLAERMAPSRVPVFHRADFLRDRPVPGVLPDPVGLLPGGRLLPGATGIWPVPVLLGPAGITLPHRSPAFASG
jgi:hypothetical protein